MKADRHTLTWTSAISFGTVAFLVFVTRPQLGRIEAAESLLALERNQQGATSDLDARIAFEQAAVERLTALLPNFNDRLPMEERWGDFLQSIAQFADRNGLNPDAVRPGAPIRSKNIVAMPVALSVRGTFPRVFSLLREIEQMPRLTLIEEFMTSIQNEETGEVSAEMRLWVYFKTSQG